MPFTLTTERSSLLGSESFRDRFSKELQNANKSITILSGYVTSTGVEWLVKKVGERRIKCTLVAQWTEKNLIEGSCDLRSYEIAKDQGWQFKVLHNLHAKIALIDDALLFIGSANLTGKGLSLLPISNRELGILVKYEEKDKSSIDKLLQDAVLVNDETYKELLDWLGKQEKPKKQAYEKFPETINSLFKENYEKIWVSNFPWCKFEELLGQAKSQDLELRKEHDFQLFHINAFDEKKIKENFATLPVCGWLIDRIKKSNNQELYFGKLSATIHNSLYDDPKPYRQDVKKLQQNLYSYIKNIGSETFKIIVPGARSEKISLV